MKQKLWLLILIPLLVPLLYAQAQARTRYASGNSVTQAQLNRLHWLKPGQSTRAMHGVLGSPDSFDRENDYYYTPDHKKMIQIPFDASGRWTGKVEWAELPPSPLSGYARRK